MRARDEELHQNDSPLAALRERIIAPDALAEGPVRFLLISGARDDTTWGLVGAFWLAIDGKRGGFLVAPEAIWAGSEMVRNLKSALARGWSHEAWTLLACRGFEKREPLADFRRVVQGSWLRA